MVGWGIISKMGCGEIWKRSEETRWGNEGVESLRGAVETVRIPAESSLPAEVVFELWI